MTNQIEKFKFFEDLQNFSALTTGFVPVLPNDLKDQKERIILVHKNFNILIRMFTKLYKTEAKSSHSFVEIVQRSEEMRDYFGISAPKPTRPGIPIDDIAILFLDGKYKLIPNSATLRIEDESGHNDIVLSKNSSSELIGNFMSEFFTDIANYVKKEFLIKLNFNGTFILDHNDVEKGHCIRCGINIELKPLKPYCYDCFQVWSEYYNAEFRENYCHQCGNYYKTTINRPLCNNCYWNG